MTKNVAQEEPIAAIKRTASPPLISFVSRQFPSLQEVSKYANLAK